ncbi:hypothetical protein [Ferruginibacter albus]|uniref:hypothetical protein n=1 Tax=Ferruginibacter albus TaxID=2875540 RepID=UPI001CC334B3|nr:hypothetical protein [Ferruginibacter albus]UAY53053.1 hypothetical protein K9M53_05085 [Ferruginibacter albus]
MAFTKKTPLEKLETKIKNLVTDNRFVKTSKTVKFGGEKLFDYNKSAVKYGYKRCYISTVLGRNSEYCHSSMP